jgi:hypothetical protein
MAAGGREGGGASEPVLAPTAGQGDVDLRLQAIATRQHYSRGQPSRKHPQHCITFVSPLMLTNCLPMPMLLRLVSSSAAQPPVTMHFEAGQELPVLGALDQTVRASVCVPNTNVRRRELSWGEKDRVVMTAVGGAGGSWTIRRQPTGVRSSRCTNRASPRLLKPVH